MNRDGREFPDEFKKRLWEILDSFRAIRLTNDEKDFMRKNCYYLDDQYLDFLSGYQYNPQEELIIGQEGSTLNLIVQGPYYKTVLWEVPLMATISELYFEMIAPFSRRPSDEHFRHLNNKDKAIGLADMSIYYSEFGTRRRYSHENQREVIEDLKQHGRGHMLGTSNGFFAMMYDLPWLGTVAHEWFESHAAMFGYLRANYEALEAWVKVYDGWLGIALPDTFTTDIFYKHAFTVKHAKLFDGVRQDSGDPLEFLAKTIACYKRLRIQPRLKTIMFSDNLKDLNQIGNIHKACQSVAPEDRMTDRYGIGTWLTNDLPGVKPLNMVIKMTALDYGNGWVETVKLSDSTSKRSVLFDEKAIELCLKTLGIQ
jgi:nicotinate phosphoribosyltransferase